MCPFHKTSQQCMKSSQGCATAKYLREHVVKHLKIKGDEEEAKAWFKRIGYRIQQNGKPKKYTIREREALKEEGLLPTHLAMVVCSSSLCTGPRKGAVRALISHHRHPI